MSVIYRRPAVARIAPHAVSVRVTPAVTLGASTVADPSVLTSLTPHGLATGDTAAMLGHVGSTPAVDGSHVVTVIDTLTFSIPVNVTVAGAGGTITKTAAVEPLTLAHGKLRAGLEWADGDPRDALMTGFIAAARAQVELDSGLQLLAGLRDVYLDDVSGAVLRLPAQCRPLQAVVSVASIDTDGDTNVLATDQYELDLVSARIGLALGGAWPTDLRPFQPYVLRIVAGWPSVAALLAAEPLLVHAVGLLTAHYATLGRDLASLSPASPIPQGYDDILSGYRPVVVA